MHIRQTAIVLAFAMAGVSAANASEVFEVTATYDPFDTANTSITVKNDSGAMETNVEIVSGGSRQSIGTLAAGASATYTFNAASGPFIDGPGDKGLSDTTTYQVSANALGTTFTTVGFSPVTNLTGGYVDFLGACFLEEIGCSIDPNSNFPESGLVAETDTTAVPLPPSFAFLLSGLIGIAGRTLRRA